MASGEDSGEIDWENYESGPYCPHWGDLGDCDDMCVRCGHTCNQHWNNLDDDCRADGCKCQGFVLSADP